MWTYDRLRSDAGINRRMAPVVYGSWGGRDGSEKVMSTMQTRMRLNVVGASEMNGEGAPAPSQPSQEGSGAAVATPSAAPSAAPSTTATPTPTTPPPGRKPLDQYKVLLHNDDENEILFVVRSLVQIVHIPTPAALKATMEAHETGVALVAITHQELAELYREQLQSKGLTATIEKA